MSDLVTALSRKYAFEFPELYHRLYRDGMLNWTLDGGSPNPNWYAEIFPRLRQRPPMLLFASDFELHAPAEVLEFDFGDLFGTAYQFVPLGQTGAGDLYAFCPTLAAGGETPIVLALHDENETTVLAPSLEGFIFRMMLDRATHISPNDLTGYADFEEFRVDLQRAAETIRPYLRPAWHGVLAEAYARPVREEAEESAPGMPYYRYPYFSLLPQAEFEKILTRELGPGRFGTTFQHLAE
jgi:hypothetical protein